MNWIKARDHHSVVHFAEATPDLTTGLMRPFVPRGTPDTCLWCAARGSP